MDIELAYSHIICTSPTPSLLTPYTPSHITPPHRTKGKSKSTKDKQRNAHNQIAIISNPSTAVVKTVSVADRFYQYLFIQSL